MGEFEKSLAAIRLGDVLLSNANKYIKELQAENVRIRAVLAAAVAVDKSPGYLEHKALHDALKAAGIR